MNSPQDRAGFEQRLDQLRDEARSQGRVDGAGVHARGGPVPGSPVTPQNLGGAGYYGLPVLKEPVWKWMIAAYFFVGGLAGMSAVVAAAAIFQRERGLANLLAWTAAIGAGVSAVLLIWDLGRPMRFINMLRVLKLQSPMSLGSWILSGFGSLSGLAVVLILFGGIEPLGVPGLLLATKIVLVGAGVFGAFLGTYTGALVSSTAIPAWNSHRVLLPFHFGMAGLGSATAFAELCGQRHPALNALGYTTAGAELLVMLWMELKKHGPVDAALHEGRSGWTLRIGELLEGPLPLIFRGFGWIEFAASSFILGALLTRFGWLWAGKASAKNPEALFAAQGHSGPAPSRS